jgi:hypothetical protein
LPFFELRFLRVGIGEGYTEPSSVTFHAGLGSGWEVVIVLVKVEHGSSSRRKGVKKGSFFSSVAR